jgi:hypothetical protein
VRQGEVVVALDSPQLRSEAQRARINAASSESRNLVPKEPLYLVRLEVRGPPARLQWTRGRIAVEGRRHSLLWGAFSYAASVLIRESGF